MNKYDEYLNNFNAVEMKEKLVKWIRNKVTSINPNGRVVVGISGGKDSTIVAALCVEALGAERVFGVLMPNNTQYDIEDSYQIINYLGITAYEMNIGEVTAAFTHLGNSIFNQLSQDAIINMPARVRMTTLYMVAQTLGNAFVVNTCNLSEDWVGYSTWHGDSAGDFSPLADLTTDEVVAIGDACGLPYQLVHKTPSDGLCGKTDEDNLGFTYYELNRYIRTGQCESKELAEKIDRRHAANKFKLEPLDKFHYIIF